MCLYPTYIKNRKYIANKKNGGIVPPLPLLYDKQNDKIIKDTRVLLVPVGCGKCIECMKQKARNWQVRLQEEIRTAKHGIFVTLTFNTETLKELSSGIHKLQGYELDNEIATIAIRRFLERWRKKYKKSVRHWLVTELGHTGTEHIHLHGIIWTNKGGLAIEQTWNYTKYGTKYGGYIWDSQREKGWVNEQTINYIVKYINKIDATHKEYKPKILTSSGIGKHYLNRIDSKLNKYNGINTKQTYTTRNGAQLPLPIYLRNKIYTDEQRETLWLDQIDKQKRYILGQEIDISKSEKAYYELLQIAREKNQRLGYGDNKINWDRRKYENDRRNFIHKTRILAKEYAEAPF